jgi:sarcosine oxidase/L-pipecolate oxidase
LRKLCKRAKGNYEDTLVRTGNINKFYSYVNHKLKTKTDIGPIVNSNGILCVDDTEKCQLFSDQFSSVFVADDGNLPTFPSRTSSVFRFSLLSGYSVYEILRHLPPKISSSPDHIPYIFLNCAALSLAHPLTTFFNRSLVSGEVPQSFKTAYVRPVFKKGNKTLVTNYRPISLTSCTSKVLERIIIKQLLLFLLQHNLLSKSQHGFLPCSSTGTQLLSCFNYFFRTLNSRKFLDCLYIDYQKAFDSVSIPKLLHKLTAYGICGSELQWFANFL